MIQAVDDLIECLFQHIPRAVIPIANVAARLGIPREAVQELVGEAQRSNRAILWPEFDAVVLDAIEAEGRGLALWCPIAESVDPHGWKWLPAGEMPPERSSGIKGFGGDYELAAQIPARHRWPDLDSEPIAEQWQAVLASQGGRLSKPNRDRLENFAAVEAIRINAIGQSAQWTPAMEIPGNPDCPVCGGRVDGRKWYCLGCSRAGLDSILPVVPKNQRPKRYVPDPDGLAGGRGRKRRAG